MYSSISVLFYLKQKNFEKVCIVQLSDNKKSQGRLFLFINPLLIITKCGCINMFFCMYCLQFICAAYRETVKTTPLWTSS